jgi:tagatose-6-phosphate ketose/aldose isomerase
LPVLLSWLEKELKKGAQIYFILSEGGLFLPDVFLMFPYILFPQTVSILTAIKCKNLTDTPSPTGTVNRVVQGVIIHPLEK